jgi:hypothetical protein
MFDSALYMSRIQLLKYEVNRYIVHLYLEKISKKRAT